MSPDQLIQMVFNLFKVSGRGREEWDEVVDVVLLMGFKSCRTDGNILTVVP